MMGYSYYMGGGWLWMLVFAALVIVPFWRILPKFGMPSWIALISFIPLVTLILLWIMAFRDPNGRGEA